MLTPKPVALAMVLHCGVSLTGQCRVEVRREPYLAQQNGRKGEEPEKEGDEVMRCRQTAWGLFLLTYRLRSAACGVDGSPQEFSPRAL